MPPLDDRVVVLSGDIGNRLFDDFKERHPTRFYNCGVAEANMTGMAAGMALCGLRPFTYTITPFATTRVMEQIRIDVCYHKAPVTIVGTGSGLSYASLGPTHHSLEDVAFLRALPNMTIVCPADAAEVRAALSAILEIDGPVYLRLGKKGEPTVHQQTPQLVIGRGLTVRQGSDVCLLALGNMVAPSLEAAALLEKSRISAMVVSMHTVKPLDEPLLRDVLGRFAVVAVVEEHSRIGGLAAPSPNGRWPRRAGQPRGCCPSAPTTCFRRRPDRRNTSADNSACRQNKLPTQYVRLSSLTILNGTARSGWKA